MKFTGQNILYTPRVSQMIYSFSNISVTSTGTYNIGTSHAINGIPNQLVGSNSGWLFHLQAGKILDPSGKFLATYNTGELFSVSGWIDFSTSYRYLKIGDIISRSPESAPTSGRIKSIYIYCPTGSASGSLSCSIKMTSQRIVSSGSLDDYNVYASSSGKIYSDVGQYVNSGLLQFYQSYESLLTGNNLIAYVDTTLFPPVNISYLDNDSSIQNNKNRLDYEFSTIYGSSIGEFNLQRTGVYSSGINTLYGLNSASGFSGLFNGLWSGNSFIYSDQKNALILNYYLSITDGLGNPYPASGLFNVSIPTTGRYLSGEYISGFSLTTGGEYMNPPLISTTGYYYSTGLQQGLDTMLFSSGCTGNLLVTFTSANNNGTGSSGLLLTTPITFSGLYGNSSRTFRTVYSYSSIGIGTGYTMAPRAIVYTGQYGSGCFDIPLASGYNEAWYRPFSTSGTIDVEAGWFTGIALCRTGLVNSGTATGYIVTGIDVYNIGTGYSNKRPPYISFIRTGVDSLTKNASGVLYTNTGSINYVSDWYIEAGLQGGSTLSSGLFSGTIPLIDSRYMYVSISNSGLDITQVITGSLSITISNISPSLSIITPFSYAKYYNTDQYALKKKLSSGITFSSSSDLSFLLTQGELDTLYSSIQYTDNSWSFSEGDFNF